MSDDTMNQDGSEYDIVPEEAESAEDEQLDELAEGATAQDPDLNVNDR